MVAVSYTHLDVYKRQGILTELRRREFYEKPTQERKRKKAAAIKRHMKRISRDVVRPAR